MIDILLRENHKIYLASLYDSPGRLNFHRRRINDFGMMERRVQLLQCQCNRNCAFLVIVPSEEARSPIVPVTVLKLRGDLEVLPAVLTLGLHFDIVERYPEIKMAI